MRIFVTAFFLLFWLIPASAADNPPSSKIKQFTQHMVEKYHFSKAKLTALLSKAKYNAEVIQKMNTPYEAKPWYHYRNYFITEKRINDGVKFWKAHRAELQQAQKKYGVAPNVIVGIIGVETDYGKHLGKFRVLDTLYTLAFNYPSRRHYFTNELEQFLILCRQTKMKPLSIDGSYAGAMGMPQFMPSSYRYYAVDAVGDGKIDLMHKTKDVIASVANYLKHAGWKPNGIVAVHAKVNNNNHLPTTPSRLKPHATIGKLEKVGITPKINLPKSEHAMLITLNDKTHNEYWLGLHNFYAISRYNSSVNYVMAVFQLGQAIKKRV